MFRPILTLVLAILTLCLALTSRGAAFLGSSRPMFAGVLLLLCAWQAYRLSSIWRAQRHGDALKKIPKRPLGL